MWFVEVPDEVRLDWLIARHRSFGESPNKAREHALGSDQANAELVATLRERADLMLPYVPSRASSPGRETGPSDAGRIG